MNIQFKDGKPYYEEVCINDIIKSFNTPLYLYSQTSITHAYNYLKKNLSSEIFFAVKANSNQAILKLMKNLGAGADVVSAGELQRALKVGFDIDKIIFEGIGKSKENIEYAVHENIRMINAESINELNLLNQIGINLDKIVNVGIRFNPNIDAQTLDKISTGKKTDKFGIALDDIQEVISLVKLSPYINLKGISCHIGSQIKDISVFKEVFMKMKKTAQTVLSAGINIKHLDLGGGFGVNYEKEHNDFDIIGIEKLISSIFNNETYKITFEPGRYLIAKSGIIITKILTTKKNGGINFLVTDAGMQTLVRPAMYGASHRIEALNNINTMKSLYTIAGPICESSDIIAKDIILAEQKINNYLVIYDVGAYGATMASNYNSRGLPAEILINKKNFSTIHNEETITEIIKRDTVPEWL